MKRILLKTVLAGPQGTKQPGKHIVSDDEAATLADAGYAEILGDPEDLAAAEETTEDHDDIEETVAEKSEARPRKNPPTRKFRRRR
jgi:hypothetical protein